MDKIIQLTRGNSTRRGTEAAKGYEGTKKYMIEASWESLATEANYRPSEVARLCNVSLRTVQRHFAIHYDLTISQWLRNIRLNKAYHRIKNGEQIKVVAYDLGFKQLSHFSRSFKEVHGVAPRLVARPNASKKIIPLDTRPADLQITANF
jgi:AraC-like DNA-binding protein